MSDLRPPKPDAIRVLNWPDGEPGPYTVWIPHTGKESSRLSPPMPPWMSVCGRNRGYHVDMAGPCFDTPGQARAHKVRKTKGMT